MLLIKKLTIIILHLVFPYSIFGNEDIVKSYYIKPIDVICEYPFNDTTKWAITCRVWGLLKYSHPNITTGKLDWDQVLLDRIEKINRAKTIEQVNAELMKLIRIAGDYEVRIDKKWDASLNMNVNLCWLNSSFIDDSIKLRLKKNSSQTTTMSSCYLTQSNYSQLPIPNEKDYDIDMVAQYEYRLLSLFRFWNVIYYFYPYKYLMDQSWDETLSEFIPKFLTAKDVSAYLYTVQQLATRLNDGHATTSVYPILNAFLMYQYISLIDSSTIVRNPPEGSLLERGDKILYINQKDIKSFRDSIALLIPSSNRNFTNNTINNYIYLSIMHGCELVVKRSQQEMTFVEKKKTMLQKVTSPSPFQPISADILYINLDLLKTSDMQSMNDSLKKYKGAIFDLRNYPKHFEYWELLRYLIPAQSFCYGLATIPDWSHIGAFYKEEFLTKCPEELLKESDKYTGKIVVLINEATISRAETFAMTFKIHGITLIGTPTAGANGNTIRFSLPGRINVGYSGLGFYFPDGTQMQRTGITPDIEVHPTIEDIIAGKDEVLEAAIEYLNSDL